MAAVKETVEAVAALEKYAHGFTSDIEQEFAPKGLNADIVRFISEKKGEPEWMLEWRLAAYERWLAMEEPTWAAVKYEPVDYQDLYYYAAPVKKEGPKSLDEVDPELLFQRFHQMPRISAIAAQVEVDRGGEADGFAFGQAEFFVQQLHEQVHDLVVGEVGGEVHCGGVRLGLDGSY